MPPECRDVRALVTGASGFVGRHLVAALAPSMTIDRVENDIRDPATWARHERADVLFHLAGQANVGQSAKDPAETFDVNATGTLRALEWARARDVGRVVLISTAHVYGPARYSPIDEEHRRRPTSPYGASKLAAEGLIESYQASYGIGGVVIRPFNMYGPGQQLGFIVPDVFAQIREGRELLVGDTSAVRDFTYIGDAVEMIAKAGTHAGAPGKAFNLGSGEGHSIATVIDTALRVSGSRLRPRVDPARFRPAEIAELVVDARRARDVLGWTATTSLEEGLRRTWASLAQTKANAHRS